MIPRDLRIRCDLCVRGIVPGKQVWGDPCKICCGRGSISLATLCKYISENESTMVKLFKPHRRMRPKTAARIFQKLAEMCWPKAAKQPELFQ